MATTPPASTRPSRPALQRRWDRRRDEVVAAAARTFAERGYAETSVAELAESLEVATGAIYHYFHGKQDLLIAICDELTEPLLAAARELPAGGDAAERLRALLRLWVAHVAGHRPHLLVFTQVRHVVDHGEGWSSVRAARKDFELLLAEALEDAGVADPDLRRLALLGMVNHMPQWYRPRGRLSPERIADGWADLILSGS
jgi:AcrR family transcriptional regulator